MLQILGRNSSANVQKVLWLAEEMRLPFKREDYGGKFGRHQTPEYLLLNPNGLVPTLIDGETIVWESNTILRYIASRYGPTSLYPSEASARAKCECWMDWQLGTLNLAMVPLFLALIRTPPEQRDLAALARNRKRASDLFVLLDQILVKREFLAGENMSLADIAAGVSAYRWFEFDIERSDATPNLKRWYNALTKRPGFRDHIMIGLS